MAIPATHTRVKQELLDFSHGFLLGRIMEAQVYHVSNFLKAGQRQICEKFVTLKDVADGPQARNHLIKNYPIEASYLLNETFAHDPEDRWVNV